MCQELGLHPAPPAVTIRADSTAAEGVIGRRGINRPRHLRVRDLCLQAAVAAKRLSVERVPSEENVADCLTKYLPRRRHEELGRAMGIELDTGARDPDGCSDGGQWQ